MTMTDQSKRMRDEAAERSLYASYANHCAIQKKIPLTYMSWKKAGTPKAPEAAQANSVTANCPDCNSPDRKKFGPPCIRFVGDESREFLHPWHFWHATVAAQKEKP